jgi:hypothetical protein
MSAVVSTAVGVRLRNLYLVRAGFALVWVALVVTLDRGGSNVAAALLVGYPLSDGLATLVELRTRPDRLSVVAHRLNLLAAAAACIAISWSCRLAWTVS